MPVYDPMPPLVRAAQNLVTARQNLEGAQIDAKSATAMVERSQNAADPDELVDAYRVLAEYAASAIGPAEAEYQMARMIFERMRGEA